MPALSPAPIRSPLVDELGIVTVPWLQWLRTLYERVGGANAASNNDLTSDLPEDAGIEEIKAGVYALGDALGQVPVVSPSIYDDEFRQQPPEVSMLSDIDIESRIAAMAEEIAVLRQQIQDLKQGATP